MIADIWSCAADFRCSFHKSVILLRIPVLGSLAIDGIAIVFGFAALCEADICRGTMGAAEWVEITEVSATSRTGRQLPFKFLQGLKIRLRKQRWRTLDAVADDKKMRPIAAVEICNVTESSVVGLHPECTLAIVTDAH